MRAEDLAKIVEGSLTGNPKAEVSGFSTDSRKITQGQVFIALKGKRHDGHSFVPDAFGKGASGAFSEVDTRPPEGRFILKVSSCEEALRRVALFRRGTFRGTVIGVAGSAGKTTTKDLIHHLLSLTANTYRSEGNLNSQIGLPLVLANMDLSARYAVVELGASRRGDVLRLTRIARPKIRVITAVGEEHLETFGTLQDVIRGNGEILHSFGEEDWAIIPAHLRHIYSVPSGRVVTFGEGGDLRAEDITVSLKGTSFSFMGERFSLPVLSRGVVSNTLAAFGVLKVLGYDPREFREHLRSFQPPPGRMNLLSFGSFYVVDDTYNANPPSVRNAVRTLSALGGGKKVVVLGDMLELGKENEQLHREAGALLADAGVDFAIFYGSETVHAWREYVRRGGKGVFLRDKEEVLEEMLKWMRDENIILLKGSRGMRMETLIDRVRELICYEL